MGVIASSPPHSCDRSHVGSTQTLARYIKLAALLAFQTRRSASFPTWQGTPWTLMFSEKFIQRIAISNSIWRPKELHERVSPARNSDTVFSTFSAFLEHIWEEEWRHEVKTRTSV